MADGGAERPEGLSPMYCRSLGGAEEAVAAVVNQVLQEGGLALWQKYLERKAFGYAAEAGIDAVVSNLRMCFVTHDTGEANFEDDWALEDEPEPSNIDSWARMHLETRRPPASDGAPPGTGLSSKARSATGRLTVNRTRSSDPRPRGKEASSGRGGKATQAESRTSPIPDEAQVDEEEESLREAKAQEEARRRDKERKAKEAEKTKEEERKTVMARHEEMRLRPHTFDQDGQVIWVEEIKAGRLPEVQEIAGFSVKKDQKARTGNLEDTIRSALTASGKDVSKEPAQGSRSEKRRMQRTGSKAHRKVPEDAWTDGFSKLQHGQPPILETMVVQSGVTLEAMGKKKAGSYGLEDRQTMTRREYNRLAERDTGAGATSADYRGSSAGHGAGREAPGTAGGAREAFVAEDAAGGQDAGRGGGSATGSAGGPSDAGGGGAGFPGAGGGGGGAEAARSLPSGGASGLLPPLRENRGMPPAGRSGSGRNLGGPDAPPAQRAPPAPPPASRHMGKKFEALGYVAFQHAPREHMPRLGGRSGLGAAQPPLGATMGHGLVRHGSLKEEYFFPPQVPDVLNVMKSHSEVSLHSGFRHGETPKGSLYGGHSKGSLKELSRDMLEGGDSQDGAAGHGKVKIEEMSPAYRNFRKALLPPESGAGSAGPPGITSGFGGRLP